MKAAVTIEPGQMELRELPGPHLGTDEVLVEVSAVGLCGSDVHLYKGEHPYVRFPRVQGHEFSGRVAATSAGYDGPLQPGDLVAVEPLRACGKCFACRHGHPNCCALLEVMGAHFDGALAEQVVVPASSCFQVSDLGPELGALVEPVSIGLQAVARSSARSGDQVLVLGAGPIGQAVTLCAVDRGAEVMVVDRLANRLELAQRLGARETLDVSTAQLHEAVVAWTGGDGPAVVVDATGVPTLVRQAVDEVAPSGTVVVVGLSQEEVSLPVLDFTRKELNVLGSRNNNGLFGAAADVVRRNRDLVAQLVTHRFGLEECSRAIELLRDHPEQAEKVLVIVNEQKGEGAK